MIRKILVSLSLIIFMLGLCLADGKAQTKIRITASVFPLMEFAQAVCGERGEVSLLLPAGAEIHTWRPRPSDLIKISKSDVFIHIGADLEPWLDDVLKSVNNPNLHILRASDSVLPIERVEHQQEIDHKEQHDKHAHKHTHGTLDPHIWLDFVIDQRIIDNIVELFSRMEPEDSELFERNGAAYKQKLEECDRRFREELGQCKNRTFILGGHAAFGYLARRYDLQQVSLYGVSPDSRPTPKQLVRVVELAKQHQINVIYFEVYVSYDLANVIAEEVGAKTLVLNPAANLTVEQSKANMTFLDIMNQNLTSLKKGLSCD
ncbi:MAG: zinc ABC transporter substrate-binding protein [Candidatus Aminicenantaceae bacterium]